MQNLMFGITPNSTRNEKYAERFSTALQLSTNQSVGTVRCLKNWDDQKLWTSISHLPFEKRKWDIFTMDRYETFSIHFRRTNKIYFAVKTNWWVHYSKPHIGSAYGFFTSQTHQYYLQVTTLSPDPHTPFTAPVHSDQISSLDQGRSCNGRGPPLAVWYLLTVDQ